MDRDGILPPFTKKVCLVFFFWKGPNGPSHWRKKVTEVSISKAKNSIRESRRKESHARATTMFSNMVIDSITRFENEIEGEKGKRSTQQLQI